MAAEPLDVDAQRRVHELVRKATQERQQALDPALLRDIKGLCKTDDENVRSAYAAIAVALKSRHSQVCFSDSSQLAALPTCTCSEFPDGSLVPPAWICLRLFPMARSSVHVRGTMHTDRPGGNASRLGLSARRLFSVLSVCTYVSREPDCGSLVAQPRLMAVELADVLFQRSRVFRGLLAPDLTTFLAKTVAAAA